MPIPRWLRWLVSPDPRPERATPRPVLLTKEVTEEDVQSAVAVFEEAVRNVAIAIDTVTLRRFVANLPTPEPFDGVPAWHPTTHETEH